MIDPVFQHEELRGGLSIEAFERCQYPSKVCRNRRTLKKNGDFHRFCDDHRAKANKNQKRWAQSRHRRWGCESPSAAIGSRKPRRSSSPTASTASSEGDSAEELAEGTATFTEMLRPYSWLEPKEESTWAEDEQLSMLLQDLLGPSQDLYGPSQEVDAFFKYGNAIEEYQIMML